MVDIYSWGRRLIEIENPLEIDEAISEYNRTLVEQLLTKIQFNLKNTIVEIGSGGGCFTLPLLGELKDDFENFYCIDSYNGPYKEDMKELQGKLLNMDLLDRVEIITRDAVELDQMFSDVDLIIGHDMLCELNDAQIKKVLTVSYHALQKNGLFIHSELAPIAQNRAEELVHLANEYSAEPLSEIYCFSPNANDLVEMAVEVGFQIINVDFIKVPIRFKHDAAIEMIARWKTKTEFLNKYENEVFEIGLEYPMEQILCCRKIIP
jgi:SAM-dependent methyltransferase